MPTDPELLNLLFPAARAGLRPEHGGLLARNLRAVSDWPALAVFAESQHLAPLLMQHTRTAGLALPDEARLALGGLAMRHRLAAQARQSALEEILAAANKAGLEVLLLKGAAAALLAYPQPGLRPMRDLDLLARPGQGLRLQDLLAHLGYRAEPSPLMGPGHRHLPEMAREVDGFHVAVEVHSELFDRHWTARPPLVSDLFARSRELRLGSVLARVPAYEDLLWHTYQHLINEGLRLVSVADMISLSEQYVTEIDWQRLRRKRPALINALALFHSLSPLAGSLVERAGLAQRLPPAPLAAGDFTGWPRISLAQARALPRGQALRATLSPPEWWLRLYFGLDGRAALSPYRYLRFPLELARFAWVHWQARG